MSFAALGRLLWRPLNLWNAFVVGSLVFVAGALITLLRGGQFVLDDAAVAAERLQWASHVRLSLGAVLLPVAAGVAVGWPTYELLLSPFAAHLPGVRRRMYRSLALVGGLAAVVTALWVASRPGAQPVLPFLASGFACFVFGVLSADPIASTWGPLRWIAALGFFAALLAAPEFVALLQSHPLPVGAACALAGPFALALPFRRAAVRRRALDPDCRANLSYRSTGWSPVPPRSRAHVRWTPGRPLTGASDWTRAALFETGGFVRGGWVAGLALNGLLWSLALIVMALVIARLKFGDVGEVVRTAHVALWQGHSERLFSTAVALPIWSAMFFVLQPFVFAGTGPYPLSRRSRTEVAWRTSLLQNLVLALFLALALGLGCEALFRHGGLEQRGAGLPDFLRPVLAAAILAPLPQAFRLRRIDARRAPAESTTHLIGLLGLVLGLPALGLSLVWQMVLSDLAPAIQVTLAVLAFVGMQILWRHELERHYRTRDLA